MWINFLSIDKYMGETYKGCINVHFSFFFGFCLAGRRAPEIVQSLIHSGIFMSV